MFGYDELTLRNAGYVSELAQRRIKKMRLLIAGCGIGSTIAEAAVRVGFTRFILSDDDRVSVHNLNRQVFVAADVGRNKAEALRDRLRAINPEVEVDLHGFVTPDTARALVGASDLVIDTIDFLDLPGIIALHDAAEERSLPCISAMSCGFGAAAVYFPPSSPWNFRTLFGLGKDAVVEQTSYTSLFGAMIAKLAPHLDPQVVEVVAKALTVMEDGRPCPASQTAIGASAVASLVLTMLVRIASDLPVTTAPRLVLSDFISDLTSPGIDLTAV